MTTEKPGCSHHQAICGAAALLLVSACSSKSHIGDPDDGMADTATPDTAVDPSPDVPPDTTPDPTIDTAPDTALDTAEDTAADLPADVPADTLPDVPDPEMRFYFGNFHAHTGFSDGEGTPLEVFTWAREVAGLDFFACTDHAESLSAAEWADMQSQAALANMDGTFVAIRGFEWSNPVFGHSVILGTADYTNAFGSMLLSTYYEWVDDNAGLAQFNHPGRELTVFGDLALEPSVVDNFFAIEVGNKGDGINDGEYYPYYVQALDNGWRIAPTANQDSHSMSTNSHRSVFIASDLTRITLLEAIYARRIYATDDPNVEITFKYGDSWMGTPVWVPSGTATFTVRVVDDEPIELVELITNGGAVADSIAPPADTMDVSWDPAVGVAAGDWFFVKVTETDILDGESPVQLAVTAPIWIN